MAIKVQFEIGHTSKLRTKKTPEGYTHDWEVHVNGVNNVDISTYVDKVVFNLHDSFPKPKRVRKEPPYSIQESGYAGFILPIDIHFRNRDEPKSVQFPYDLDLQQTGPPQHHSEIKKFIFEFPADDFRHKLLKGGGIPVAAIVSGGVGPINTQNYPIPGGDEGMVSKPKLSGSDLTLKKHKSHTDDPKTNTFANLFGPPIKKGASSKHSPDNKNSNLNSKGLPLWALTQGVHPAISSTNNINISTTSKDRMARDRDKSSNSVPSNNIEKTKERSDKKDKHRQSSPHKDSRNENKKSSDVGKHDKRSDEKSKKDRSRDKERDRDPDKRGGSSAKRSFSPKSNSRDVISTSPKRVSPTRPSSSSSNKNSNEENKQSLKSDIKTRDNSISTNKKSKKDKSKKDKTRDKERDRSREQHTLASGAIGSNSRRNPPSPKSSSREMTGVSPRRSPPANQQRDDHRDKHRINELKSKEDRFNNMSSLNLGNNGSISTTTPIDAKEAKSVGIPAGHLSSKQRDLKLDSTKISGKLNEKDMNISASNPSASTSVIDKKTNNSLEKDKKSHKHKKREKNKYKEKSVQKANEKSSEVAVIDLKKSENAEIIQPNNAPPHSGNVNTGAPLNTANIKKTQTRERKSKETKSNKEEKRSRDSEQETRSKHSRKSNTSATSQMPCLNNSSVANLDLSDVDSLLSVNENSRTASQSGTSNVATASVLSVDHTDSSNSSFPDLSSKGTHHLLPPSMGSTTKKIDSPSTKETKAMSNRSRGNEKTTRANAVDKSAKVDKDERKRRRNSSPQTNAFIEPPLKQGKKDQAKMSNEKSKSPSLRSGSGRGKKSVDNNANNSNIVETSGNAAFLPPPNNATGTSVSSSPATCNITNLNSNIASSLAPPLHPSSPALAADAVSGAANANNSGNAALPTDYLIQLQELHHKIMSLKDNEELQQVVEMIAATGCYEITAQTFDFDLCKLDRNTVQRLQEFLATSVS